MKQLEVLVIDLKKNKPRKKRLFYQLFPSMLGMSLIGVCTILAISHYTFKNFFFEQTIKRLREANTAYREDLKKAIIANDIYELKQLSIKTGHIVSGRVTVINPKGQVLFDTHKESFLMDNHLERPEIQDAKNYNYGQKTRVSRTLNEELLYVAESIKDSNQKIVAYLRSSVPTVSLQNKLNEYYVQVLWFVVILLFVLTFVTWVISQKISRPIEHMTNHAQNINEGDLFDLDLKGLSPSVEIISLTQALYKMSKKIKKQFKKIQSQKEERESVFSSMVEGVISIDLKGKIFHWNQAACRLFEVNQTQNLKGRNVDDVFQNDRVIELYKKILDRNEIIEEIIYLENGRVLQAHGTLLSTPIKPKLGVLFVFNDITKIRELESHRKDFVANVSHELRTPLTAIQGFMETLIDDSDNVDPEMQRKFLGIIKKNTDRLRQIIEDLLALSQFEKDSENTSLSFEVQDVVPVITNSIQINEIKASRKNIRIVFDPKDSSEFVTKVNAHLLEQAISNLIDNAIKYSPIKTSVSVEIKQTAQDIIISIKDQGSGIGEEHLPRLFERFYSVDKARSREMGGSGLGLSIVKHIILAHDGEVNVESEIGKGTRFVITIPKATEL
ncbi:MAG: ATP-binding protein [Bacteriovoracaceae bacterium]